MSEDYADITSVEARRCNCWAGNPENYEGPQRTCPEHGENPDWNDYPPWASILFHQRDEAIAEREVLRQRIQRVIELHTDSVAGVCPSCARIGDQSDEDDGLVAWPCPTVRVLDPEAGS